MIMFEISQYWQECKIQSSSLSSQVILLRKENFVIPRIWGDLDPQSRASYCRYCGGSLLLLGKKAKAQTTRTLKVVLVQKWRFSVVVPNDCFLRGIIFIACAQFFNPAQSPQDRWGHDKSLEVHIILLDWVIFNSASSHYLSISCFFQTTGERNKTLAALWHLALLKHSCNLEWSAKGKFCGCGQAELERNLRSRIGPGSHYLNSAFLALTVCIYSSRPKKTWGCEKGWCSHQ